MANNGISKAPPPVPQIDGRSSAFPAPLPDDSGADARSQYGRLLESISKCDQLIRTARMFQRFPGALWDIEANRWTIYRPQVDAALAKCQQEQLPNLQLSEIRERIKVLDEEWAIASELRRGATEIGCGKLRKKGKAGAPERYDWDALKHQLREHLQAKGGFETRQELRNWCIENLRLKAGAPRPRGKSKDDPPDPHTVSDGIRRRHLHEINGIFRGNP
jgi:hypothetical protein